MNYPPLDSHTCVAQTAAGQLLSSDAHGIAPPLHWLREDSEQLRGAVVSDKMIGKAAALLFAYGGVRGIWAARMSKSARDFLQTTGIVFEYETLVPAVLNRGGTGLCPMEQRALGTEDPAEAFALFDGIIPR